MKKCLAHLGPWTIGDLSFGINALVDRHKGLSEELAGKPITDVKLLKGWIQDLRMADAIYERSQRRVVENCGLREEEIREFHTNADRLRPAFCIAVRPSAKEVLLIVRGTRSPADAVTILTGSAAEFQGGHTHAGMLHSAEWLLHHKTKTLVQLLKENPGYSLRFIGHSLGAGAAALYALMLRQQYEAGKGQLQQSQLPICLAIATPACATKEIAESCRAFVTTMVCQNDLVPRASLFAFERLRMEVKDTNWQKELDKLIEEGLTDFTDKLKTNVIGEQYKKMAELLKRSYPGTAKLVNTVGDAWESIASSTSNEGGAVSKLLRSTSMKLARLPATGSQPEPVVQNFADPKVLHALSQNSQQSTRSASRSEQEQGRDSPGSDGKIEESQSSGIEQDLRHLETSRVQQIVAEQNEDESKGDVAQKDDSGSGEGISQAQQQPKSVSWSSWFAGLWRSRGSEKEADQTRKQAMRQLGKDMEDLAHLQGPSKAEHGVGDQPIPVASDGDVDAELSHILLSMEEAEARDERRVAPMPQMYPPGKLVFLRRTSGTSTDGTYKVIEADEGQMVHRILLSKSMIIDHLCTTYIAAVESYYSLQQGQQQ